MRHPAAYAYAGTTYRVPFRRRVRRFFRALLSFLLAPRCEL